MSFTEAVSVTAPPGATTVEFVETVVCVGSWVTVSDAVPELEPRSESPE